jgi:hypothetical protein
MNCRHGKRPLLCSTHPRHCTRRSFRPRNPINGEIRQWPQELRSVAPSRMARNIDQDGQHPRRHPLAWPAPPRQAARAPPHTGGWESDETDGAALPPSAAGVCQWLVAIACLSSRRWKGGLACCGWSPNSGNVEAPIAHVSTRTPARRRWCHAKRRRTAASIGAVGRGGRSPMP